LAVLNLCIRIELRLSTFDTNQSISDSTQSDTVSAQRLPDSAVQKLSTARIRLSRCVGRNYQVIERSEISCWFFACNVHTIYKKWWRLIFLAYCGQVGFSSVRFVAFLGFLQLNRLRSKSLDRKNYFLIPILQFLFWQRNKGKG